MGNIKRFTLTEYLDGQYHQVDDETTDFFNDINNFKIDSRKMSFDGVDFYYSQIKTDEPALMTVLHPNGFLKIQFELSGYSDFRPDPNEESCLPVLIENGHFNGIYMPYISGKLNYIKSRNCIDIKMTPAYLRKLIGKHNEQFSYFIDKVDRKEPVLFFDKSQEIGLDIMKCIREILRPKTSVSVKNRYLEHKIAELVLLAVDKACAKNPENLSVMTELSDHSKVLNLKEYIESNPCLLHSTTDLAKHAGMSETKLKRLFGQLVGESLMSFVRCQKLQYAKYLLRDGQYTIKEIAYQINYRHSQHFSAAFKREYGMLPSEFQDGSVNDTNE